MIATDCYGEWPLVIGGRILGGEYHIAVRGGAKWTARTSRSAEP